MSLSRLLNQTSPDYFTVDENGNPQKISLQNGINVISQQQVSVPFNGQGWKPVNSSLISLPSPSEEEMASEEFKAVWELIKKWDISVDSSSYQHGSGSHVKMILDVIRPALRDSKIDKILEN